MQSAAHANCDNEELLEIETMDELCRKLGKSRRDPEFTPSDYLSEVIRRLNQKSSADITVQECWNVCHGLEKSWPWLLSSANSSKQSLITRQKCIELLVLISGVPTNDTEQGQLFALNFLTRKDAAEPSVIDHMLTISENCSIDLIEMKQIGLILGNLALDGISARENLVQAILQSNYIDRVV